VNLVPGFIVLLQALAPTMTTPTFESFVTVATGWVFSGSGTITRSILSAGDLATKHFSSYHRLFSAALWSLDAVGLAVFDLIEPWLGEVVMLGIDDTLARKRGLKIFGVGMHHDPLRSTRSRPVTSWGLSWVSLGVIVRLPFRADHSYYLPLVFRLYQNKTAAAKSRRGYRSRPELAVELLHLLCNHRKNRRLHVVGDSAYGGQSVLCNLPENCDITSRLLPTARLYGPPPAPEKGRMGRPRKRGDRLPAPAAMLEGRCRRIALDIYGRSHKARATDCVARVFAAPSRPLRVVATEAIGGGRGVEVFYSTCVSATAEQVIGQYASRWSIEVAYRDVKQCLGFEQPQGWCRKTVERTAPMAMLIYSLVIIWFAREGHRHWQPAGHAWYSTKRDPSFADMLAELKRRSIRGYILSIPLDSLGPRKLFRILENTINLAA
jgi:hypothetical protein